MLRAVRELVTSSGTRSRQPCCLCGTACETHDHDATGMNCGRSLVLGAQRRVGFVGPQQNRLTAEQTTEGVTIPRAYILPTGKPANLVCEKEPGAAASWRQRRGVPGKLGPQQGGRAVLSPSE